MLNNLYLEEIISKVVSINKKQKFSDKIILSGP